MYDLDVTYSDSYNLSSSNPNIAKTTEEIRTSDDSQSSDDASYDSNNEMKRITALRRSNDQLYPRRISGSDRYSLESRSMIDLSNIPSPSHILRRHHSRHRRHKLNEELERLYSNLYDEIKWRETNCD
ncbi:uncharacterized protein LOC111621365 [Centruroides sculpturatus]|uniref:uncharacterized protein LOC111621365 n=1 Tax=Centruroides sculpturatus TaxID=218467 RepID=UPI000C6D758C|nr:uncharacterized protein LOC111621365 [Centruroides sculpturatus]